MRQLLFYMLCLAPLVCAADLGASLPVLTPSIDLTACPGWADGVRAKDDHECRGPRGHRGHRGEKGKKGEKGPQGTIDPSFSKGSLQLAEGQGPILIPTSTSPTFPYIVPLNANFLDTNILFDAATNSFEVQECGTYFAEFFLKAFSTSPGVDYGMQGQLVIALRNMSTNTYLVPTKLVPVEMGTTETGYDETAYTIDASATHQALLHLNQGDRLQLVVIELPTTFNYTGSPTLYLPAQFVMIGGTSDYYYESDEVAFLTLLKVT